MPADLSRVLEAYKRYTDARNALLDELNLKRRSNRDPLSEFSEWLVAALLDGTRAESPVQVGWDVLTADQRRVQVKYLANPADKWVNEHRIQVTDMMDDYAIVFIEALLPLSVIVFPAVQLGAIGGALGKRHENLDTTLQLTRSNYTQILSQATKFSTLGVRVFLGPDWHTV